MMQIQSISVRADLRSDKSTQTDDEEKQVENLYAKKNILEGEREPFLLKYTLIRQRPSKPVRADLRADKSTEADEEVKQAENTCGKCTSAIEKLLGQFRD